MTVEDKVWKVGNMATKIMRLVVYNVAWAEAYLGTQWHIDPSSHLATTDMGRKLHRHASLWIWLTCTKTYALSSSFT